MGSISFWLAALGLPIAAVIVNCVARWLAHLPQSAPADMVLAFVVFDAIVIMQGDDFRHHVPFEEFSMNLTAIYVMYIFVGMFLWAVSVFHIERKIVRFYQKPPSRRSGLPVVTFTFSLFIPVMLILASVTPSVYIG